jgi:hypothetical protein
MHGMALLMFVVWVVGWAAFKLASGAIHLTLFLAAILLLAHFFRGRRAL